MQQRFAVIIQFVCDSSICDRCCVQFQMKLEVLKRANRRHAYIVFFDEAGFMLSPHVRTTWARRGCTPVIRVTEPHGRISVAGAISISPKRRIFRFFFWLSADNANFRGYSLVPFLEFLRRKITGPITLIWDQIAIHRAAPIVNYLHQHRRIVVEPFPQYAPELNPVDYVWGNVKCARLANYTPHNLVELRVRITKEFRRIQHRPDLLRSFFNHAGLTLDPRECYRESGQDDLKPAALPTKRKYMAFDIETAKPVVFEDPDWRRYRPLGICCATTLLEGEETALIWHGGTSQKRPTRQMKRRELLKLLEYLARKAEDGFTILTWNGVGFDFDVLVEESGESKLCRQLAAEHVDMMFHILCRIGFGVALDSAAKGMGIEGKDRGLSSASAPVLWGKGMHEDVFEYVKRDVRTTLALGKLCEARGRIDWSTCSGKLRSLLIPKGWLTVKQAMKLPEPANAWLFDQWRRNKFTHWLE